MPVRETIPVKSLLAEGVVIVVSVLLALAADAWLDRRQEDEAVAQHLQALQRDFGQMEARMDSVVGQNARNFASSQVLLGRLTPDAPPIPSDSLHSAVVTLVDYAVFSPSTAAYSSLTATGQIELLDDPELKRLLAEFFGYFEDFEVTEAAIQRVVFDMLLSEEFGQLIGFDEVVRRFGAGVVQDEWTDASEIAQGRDLMNHLGVLSAMYLQASQDYLWMSDRIGEIRARLPAIEE